MAKHCKLLNKEQQSKLYNLLNKHKTLFDGTLGKWKHTQHQIKLVEGAEPYHGKSYKIPQTYEATLKLEVDRLIKLQVLRKVNHSQWEAPCFIIPKKDGTVRFISDFREVNKRIKRYPYPIPNIQDLLMKSEGFRWATTTTISN